MLLAGDNDNASSEHFPKKEAEGVSWKFNKFIIAHHHKSISGRSARVLAQEQVHFSLYKTKVSLIDL